LCCIGLCSYSFCFFFFFSSRRRHTRSDRDWSSDVCSSDLDFVERSAISSPISLRLGPGTRTFSIASRPTKSPLAGLTIQPRPARSEERRVGKECRSRRGADQ